MALIYLVIGTDRFKFSVQELKDWVLITPDLLYGPDRSKGDQGKSESAVTLGSNTLALPQYEWWYGFTDSIETWSEKDEQISEVRLDCIELIGFERSAQSFAEFYPAGVDGVEGPSVDFVYRDSLEERNTLEDRANFPPERVARHIKAAEGLLKKNRRRLLIVQGPQLHRLFAEHRWYILGLGAQPGIPAIFHPFPDAFDGKSSEKIEILWVLQPDLLTRRRLERVVSLDFVRDLDIEPPKDPDTKALPVLVLMPSEEDLEDGPWEDWEEYIADLGPLIWDEDTVVIKLPDPPVKESQGTMDDEQTVDAGDTDKPIVLNPVSTKKKKALQTNDKLKEKKKDEERKPLGQLDQNVSHRRTKLQASPIAAKRRKRSRTSPAKFKIYEDQ